MRQAIEAPFSVGLEQWRYDSGWQYDDGNGAWSSFTARDSDILVAEVDFATNEVTSLEGTDDYYGFMTKGFNGGDLMFHENMYGSANTASTGDVFIAGSFLITVSIELMSYPSVLATSSSTPAEFSSSGQSVSYHQYETDGTWQVDMKIESYYTLGASPAPWQVFDGKWNSSASVQQPSFTYHTHVAKAMVHSAPWQGDVSSFERPLETQIWANPVLIRPVYLVHHDAERERHSLLADH